MPVSGTGAAVLGFALEPGQPWGLTDDYLCSWVRSGLQGRMTRRNRGLALIPPYEHPDVIAGQGTAALEIRAAR